MGDEEKDYWAETPDTQEEIEEELKKEGQKWNNVQMSINQIGIPAFLLNSQIQGLMRLLISKGIITEEEIDLFAAKQQLAGMREIREQHQSQIAQARILEGIRNSPIIGTNGQPIDPTQRM